MAADYEAEAARMAIALTLKQKALLAEAVADPDGQVRAVTTRQRTPDPEGARRAELLRAMAEEGLVQLHAITGDRNSPVGEHAMVFVVTAAGRELVFR